MGRASQRARGGRNKQMSPRQMREAGIPERTGASDDFQPIQIDATGPRPTDDQIPFMSITELVPGSKNGETRVREFTIPREVPPNIVIRYMENVRHQDADYAMAELMADLLGDDAMAALAACEHVSEADMRQIMDIVQDKTLATMEKYQGN